MAASFYITLASATLLAVGASTLAGRPFPLYRDPEVATTPFPEIKIDSYNDSEGNDNDTYSGFGFTRYLYLDFPKIGYTIFKQKMLDALNILDKFMNMKPAWLKISKYFMHSNNKNDSFCLICAGMSSADDTYDYDAYNVNSFDTNNVNSYDASVETNTESPKNSAPLSTQETSEIDPQSDSAFDRERDEVKRTKVEPEGFFAKSFSAFGGFFRKIGSWFG